MATTAKGMYKPYSHHRGETVSAISITLNASPAVASDPGGIVQSVTKTAMATGVYVVTLKRNYSRILATGCNTSALNALVRDAKVTGISAGGTSANTITITATTKGGVADDSAGTVVSLGLHLYDS